MCSAALLRRVSITLTVRQLIKYIHIAFRNKSTVMHDVKVPWLKVSVPGTCFCCGLKIVAIVVLYIFSGLLHLKESSSCFGLGCSLVFKLKVKVGRR